MRTHVRGGEVLPSQHAGEGLTASRGRRTAYALSDYRSDGRSILEGHPGEGMPGPSADEQTRKVVGLLLVRWGEVSVRVISRTVPASITCWHSAETLASRTEAGRQERCCPEWSAMLDGC
jgi:hypothetical protein